VQRAGKIVKLTVPLEPDLGRHEIVIKSRSPFQGAKFANISEAVAKELHLNEDAEGVVLIEPGDRTIAAKVGFKRGDIITSVNNQRISKTSDLEKATNQPTLFWRVVGSRDGEPFDITVPMSE
jgi:S1-C subfamily serine protease